MKKRQRKATVTDSERLERAIDDIWEIAAGFGLDPFEINFEMVPAHIMYEFGAYGLPSRFSHWTFGRAYQEMKTMYDYGLNKIYELVINTDPCYGFLLQSNSVLQNKLVVAHVIGHADFFKNNLYFQQTARDMLEIAGVNAERIRGYEFQHGRAEVEAFLDAALSIQEHVDPNQLTRAYKDREAPALRHPRQARVANYADLFHPEELVSLKAERERRQHVPAEPEKDLLLFLTEYAEGLHEWQRDILNIVRSEMLYFLPQMLTKIMNEGWAAYWHARIMRELDLTPGESIEFAALHANVLAPSERQVNPYLVGIKILEDIERRWDNPSEEERTLLGRQPGQGRAKMFEVRESESDVSFLRNYLTGDLIRDLDLHVFNKQEGGEEAKSEETTSWEEIRDTLVGSLNNFGYPYLQVEDGNFHNEGELLIKHVFDGQELDLKYAERTMPYLHKIWGRPVHLETIVEEKRTLLTFDGDPEGLKKEPLEGEGQSGAEGGETQAPA